MKIRYLLKRKGQGAQHPVYLALYLNDQTEIIFTGQRIQLSDWSVSERQPKKHNSDIYRAIEKVKHEVQKTIRRLEADEQPVTPYTVKDAYVRSLELKVASQANLDKKSKSEAISIVKMADHWIENEIFRFRKSTQKSVKESINAFKAYLLVVGLGALERRDLTQDTISKYERYLLEKKKLSDNTHGKRMKHLRWFLKTLDFDITKIKIRSSKKTIVALTIEELKKLEHVNVSSSLEKQKAKDLFLLGCYTGLRISDLKRLNVSNTVNGFITLKLLKNNRDVRIPIIKECHEILARYGFRAPRISEQALNENIKKVCNDAKITDLIEVDTTEGGNRLTTMVPKNSVITSHIAGKTFITLAPKKWNLTPAEIAAIVGKDLKTLINSYFQLPLESAINKMTAI